MFRFREINDDKTITDVVTYIETANVYKDSDENLFDLWLYNRNGDSWVFEIESKDYLDKVLYFIETESYKDFNKLNLLGYDFEGILESFDEQVSDISERIDQQKDKKADKDKLAQLNSIQMDIDSLQQTFDGFFAFADDLSLKNNR